MFALGQFLVETPKHLDDTEGSRSNGIGKVTTGWRDSTDDTDRTLTLGTTLAFDTSGTFVEGGQTSTEVGWVTTN